MHRLAAYLKERQGFDSIVTEDGFAAYRLDGEDCFIYDIFVSPDYRKRTLASQMVMVIEKIAQNAGCKYLSGSVNVDARGATDSIKFILAYGLDVHSVSPPYIKFRKEL